MKQFLAIAIIVGCMSIPARAQNGNGNGNNGNGNIGGCEDSPENPTIILAGLAMAGFGVAQWRRKRSTVAQMKLRPSNEK